MVKQLKFLILLFITCTLHAQERKDITLDDIFSDFKFYPKSVRGINWMNNKGDYSSMQEDANGIYIIRKNIANADIQDTLFATNLFEDIDMVDDYFFTALEDKMLISTQQEKIYRRSSKAFYYLFNRKNGELMPIPTDEKIMQATFSPGNEIVAYVKANNLFLFNPENKITTQITDDGKFNSIINGVADWVYEEEFSFTNAFKWSPDGKKIAYYKFDESRVPVYNMQKWDSLYPSDYQFKYPKAGENNSKVSIWIYNVEDSTHQKIIDSGADGYIPRVYWLPDSRTLSTIKLNRLQNKLSLYHCDLEGNAQLVLSEESDTYVDINFNDHLTYLKDGESFLYTSERSGYKHIYHYTNSGELISQVTSGNWVVDDFFGINETKNMLYFTSTEESPLERHLYSIELSGKNKKMLTDTEGVHKINMNPDFSYFIDVFSNKETPPVTSLHTLPDAKKISVLEDNQELKKKFRDYKFGEKRFFDFAIDDGTKLNGFIIKPADFDKNKQYPLLMFVYGGPGSQEVMNEWGGLRNTWFHYLTQQGYIVACVDNRGTGGRGKGFKHATYGRLGALESEDQIAAAKYLGNLDFIDHSSIAIFGWSYGGYMSSLCILLGNSVFNSAIAVAPVTNWRFYDTIYTERYLKTPQLNPGGYDDYSPINHAEKLNGNFLLIHGTGDDNVHFQNTVEFTEQLVKEGKHFDVFFYPDRNHGIYGGNTYRHLYGMMTNFLMQKN